MKLSRRGLLGGLIALPVVGKAVASVVEKAEVVKDTAKYAHAAYLTSDLMCTAGTFHRMDSVTYYLDESGELQAWRRDEYGNLLSLGDP